MNSSDFNQGAWPLQENEEQQPFEIFNSDSYNAWDDYEDCYYDMEEQALQQLADQMQQDDRL
jgi:hypothetical protein